MSLAGVFVIPDPPSFVYVYACRVRCANDGSSPVETQPAGSGPGVFRAAWSGTQYKNLVPFVIANPADYVGSAPPDLDSLAYAAALAEVKLLGNAAIPTPRTWTRSSTGRSPPGRPSPQASG